VTDLDRLPGEPGGADEDRLVLPDGRPLELERHPLRPREQLRAWDSADALAVEHLATMWGPTPARRVAVLGDEWGAIACGLLAVGAGEVVHIGDSFVARLAAVANLERNGLSADQVCFVDARTGLVEPVDALVVKPPKALATFDEWLRVVRPALAEGSEVVTASMTRHLHTSTLGVLEARLGPTRTTLARRRARLALSQVSTSIDPASRWPRRWRVAVGPSGDGPTVVAHVNAFAAEGLDAGTEVLLAALAGQRPDLRRTTLVDLGCGTGVVGLVEAWRDPSLEVVFVDESFDAVASAEAGWRATFGTERQARFVIGDRLEATASGDALGPGSVDRIVVNPPFHSGHALSDATAWDMFVQSRRALRGGGDLWVVGNRHLGYHTKLKRVFGNVAVVASTPAFVVLRSERR
jgi:23S rRNA (guanine1835-N2)-methyltransferase